MLISTLFDFYSYSHIYLRSFPRRVTKYYHCHIDGSSPAFPMDLPPVPRRRCLLFFLSFFFSVCNCSVTLYSEFFKIFCIIFIHFSITYNLFQQYCIVLSDYSCNYKFPLIMMHRTHHNKWESHTAYSTELTQLFISMAIVIGPTPPGTGVIALVCGATLSKSTSPQSLFSAFLWIPTSMTTAPSFT